VILPQLGIDQGIRKDRLNALVFVEPWNGG
jgi:hypothetical protein